MEARAYRCPQCGGGVDEQARRCPFCAAPIATVRCASCYHMNVVEARCCAACGRELGLEPIPEPDTLECPECRAPFSAYSASAGVLHDCAACGGQFIEHALLRELLERRESYGAAAPRAEPRRAQADVRVRYVPCPVCRQLMNRKNFAGTSGVIVDVCSKHGIWFDRGELPRVMAFAESGGLTKARRRDEEEKARVLREAHLATLSTRLGNAASADADAGLDLGVKDLLDFLRDLKRNL